MKKGQKRPKKAVFRGCPKMAKKGPFFGFSGPLPFPLFFGVFFMSKKAKIPSGSYGDFKNVFFSKKSQKCQKWPKKGQKSRNIIGFIWGDFWAKNRVVFYRIL